MIRQQRSLMPTVPSSGTCKFYSARCTGHSCIWGRTAFPLIPARPVTDGKAQGLGFEYTVCNFVGPPGGKDHTLHIYVMLSRFTTLAGVSVLRNFDSKDIKGKLPGERCSMSWRDWSRRQRVLWPDFLVVICVVYYIYRWVPFSRLAEYPRHKRPAV